jgi:hypothetical protein
MVLGAASDPAHPKECVCSVQIGVCHAGIDPSAGAGGLAFQRSVHSGHGLILL